MSRYQEVTEAHPSANGATPTRNANAERGVGRAFRHEADMLPRSNTCVSVQRPGMSSARSAHVGRAWEEKKGVLGKTGSVNVAVRSGNSDPAAIGINKINWGIAGVGEAPAAPVASAQSGLFLVGGIAALAAVFLLMKK